MIKFYWLTWFCVHKKTSESLYDSCPSGNQVHFHTVSNIFTNSYGKTESIYLRCKDSLIFMLSV